MSQTTPKRLELEEFNQLFVIEYSVSQNAVGVKTVNEMLEANRNALSQGLSSDYLPVAFFESREKAVEMSNKLTDNIREMNSHHTKLTDERNEMFDRSEDSLWSYFFKKNNKAQE